MFVCVQYQQEIALLQEKLRVAALRQDECEARLLVQDQQNQRMLQEYQVCNTPDLPVRGGLKSHLHQLCGLRFTSEVLIDKKIIFTSVNG